MSYYNIFLKKACHIIIKSNETLMYKEHDRNVGLIATSEMTSF